ncbi:MAG: hypothetical protein ACRC6A_01935 [Fusobacteriaceae bacterium]
MLVEEEFEFRVLELLANELGGVAYLVDAGMVCHDRQVVQTAIYLSELPHPNKGWGFVGSILAT